VASFNNLLALKYGDQLDETANRYLEYSVAGAKRLQLMLRGLLQYTMTTPGAVRPVDLPVEILMQSVLQELQPEIQQTEATINVISAEGTVIRGDREMLRTVAVALISNALKFRHKDSPPQIEVGFVRGLQEWSMSVSDNGIGVEEHFMPRMFEMFARFHPVGEHPGAGVGLALSKRIITCHGGELSVTPNPEGHGTVFTVCVPIPLESGRNTLETQRFPY
jgi:light-regulated signal transduction histidine kinase (bacteriophytochrome)